MPDSQTKADVPGKITAAAADVPTEVIAGGDTIVGLDRGETCETGCHHDLIGRGGSYSAIWRAQTCD